MEDPTKLFSHFIQIVHNLMQLLLRTVGMFVLIQQVDQVLNKS